ncbi:hydrophobin 1 [Fusarium subglutinans]|uniref:Hydrophobin 1 n=1 Tax=Gibberella subglutinans TaxID=42677 RepID=A0A8H5V5P1_GIBSU|nr:hydrophobin 1 [Fusarium subglutinans]KAF5611942.1 hydrophobin 1 [Fusarium subglutinans]
MKFTASVLTLLAVATGALASPHGPPSPSPSPSSSPQEQQQQQPAEPADVECVSFTNGGLGGVCNGIQMCCNNNNGNQGCNFNVGGGTITIKKTVKNFGW